MKINFQNFFIKGIASAVPEATFDLHELDGLYGKSEIDRIMASTGIQKVRVAAPGICASNLCVQAAKVLMQTLELNPESIDGIVFISQTPDYILPSTSACIQHELGLAKNVVAFDINYGCSGYIYGLYQAAMMLAAGGCRRVLICAGDTITRLINPRDRSIRMVFGDGGSATIVERRENPDKTCFIIKTDGAGAEQLIVPAGGFRCPSNQSTGTATECEEGNFRSLDNLYMNGLEIMSFAIREVPVLINELLEECCWDRNEVGVYALHQANKFMLEYLRKKLKVKAEAVPQEVLHIGNTGSASIPIMLTSQYKTLQEQARMKKVIACGFGVGLSWGAVSLDLSETIFCDPVEV